MYDYPPALMEHLATTNHVVLVDLVKLDLGDVIYRWCDSDGDWPYDGETYLGNSVLISGEEDPQETFGPEYHITIADPAGTWAALIKQAGETGLPIEYRHCVAFDGELHVVETLLGVTSSINEGSTGFGSQGGSDTVIVSKGYAIGPGQVLTRYTGDHFQRENIDKDDWCYFQAHRIDLIWSV